MPRGMDERFEDPSGGSEGDDNSDASAEEETSETSSESDGGVSNTAVSNEDQSERQGTVSESSASETEETDGEPLNIRQDWDSSTIYVEPEQSVDIEVTFTRLKKQLKREDIVLEKNKHFYRAIFEVAFGEHREETKEKIREIAKEDTDQ